MATTYLHGAYGSMADSISQPITQSGTIAVYVGTAPVNLVREYGDYVNAPVKLDNLSQARRYFGDSINWTAFTLCEPFKAHFNNPSGNVGPIIAINVLDPDLHRKAEATTQSLIFANKRATIDGDTIITDTLRIGRPALAEPEQPAKLYGEASYAQSCADVGLTFENNIYHWEPTGDEIPELFKHGDTYYIGIVFTPPTGATACKTYIDGTLLSDIPNFTTASDSTPGDGTVVQWFPFADADGTPKGDRVYEVKFEWTGGDTPVTACYIGRNILDYQENVDYTLDYDYAKQQTIVNDISAAGIQTAQATYYEVDPSMITKEDIIGGETAGGEYSGLGCIKLVYQELNWITNLIAAPGWSHDKDVYDAMITAGMQINGHWDAYVVADLPIDEVGTIEEAQDFKKNNGFDNERTDVYWPMGQDSAGDIYHISTAAVWQMLQTDATHNGIPFESPSNKETFLVKQYFGPNSRNKGFDQSRANELNAAGIGTIVYWGARWVLWGPHTAAYQFGAITDPRNVFGVSMRMLMYLTNGFQQRHALQIDEPMDRALKDTILNQEQKELDALVAMGALLGTPVILFDETTNSTQEMLEGNFYWDFQVTPTPPAKSLNARIAYTDAGFQSLLGGAA